MTDEWLEDFLRRAMECDEVNHLARTWNILMKMHEDGEIDEHITIPRLARILRKIKEEEQ